jgi:ABC-type multidrug transport system fused ATPase/permease subunit
VSSRSQAISSSQQPTLTRLLALHAALSRVFSFSGDFSRAVHGFKSFSAWKERTPAFATLNLKADARLPAPSNGPATIEIENLTFAYPSRPGKLAIADLSLTIRAGEKLALCGPSGGGKSSVLACIARFYEPTSGTVKVDGIDVRSLSLDDHWGSIALVAQDASLYGGTARLPPLV